MPKVHESTTKTRRWCFSDTGMGEIITAYAHANPDSLFSVIAPNRYIMQALMEAVSASARAPYPIIRRQLRRIGWSNGARVQFSAISDAISDAYFISSLRGVTFDATLWDARGMTQDSIESFLGEEGPDILLRANPDATQPFLRIYIDPPLLNENIAYILPAI